MKSLLKIYLKEEQCRMRSKELADSYSLEELQSRLDQIMRDMEQEAEPEGGPVADMYADEMDAYEQAIKLSKNPFEKDSVGGMTYDDMLKKHYPNKDTKDLGEGKIGGNSYKTRCLILGKDTEVFIDNSNTLDDVTIRWRGANHWGNKTFEHLQFEADDVIDDHGNEGKDMVFIARSEEEDGNWVFMVDVYVEASYELSGNIGDWDWDTLEIDKEEDLRLEPEDDEYEDGTEFEDDDLRLEPELDEDIDEGTCGYGKKGKLGKKPAGPHLIKKSDLRERFIKLAGIIK